MVIGLDTFPASFRGVPFQVPRETEHGGIKYAQHEYPGANFRYIEPLGINVPVYNVTAIVHGILSSAQRRLLVHALQSQEVGTLVHPVYGTVQVQPTEYTVSSSEDALGEHVFDITFFGSRASATLSPAFVTAAFISSLFSNFRPTLFALFGSTVLGPTTGLNIASVVNILSTFTSTFRNVLILPSALIQPASQFLASLNFIDNNSNVVAATPASMQRFVSAPLQQSVTLYEDVSDPLNAWLGLASFDTGEDPIAPTTAERQQRETNRIVYQDFIQTFSLAAAMEASVYREYRTAQEITTVIDQIEERFTSIFREPRSDITRNFDTAEQMSNLYTQTVNFLKALNINAPMVVSVRTDASSAALTAYQYYGSVDREEAVAGLNPNKNRAVLLDDIEVLTE